MSLEFPWNCPSYLREPYGTPAPTLGRCQEPAAGAFATPIWGCPAVCKYQRDVSQARPRKMGCLVVLPWTLRSSPQRLKIRNEPCFVCRLWPSGDCRRSMNPRLVSGFTAQVYHVCSRDRWHGWLLKVPCAWRVTTTSGMH